MPAPAFSLLSPMPHPVVHRRSLDSTPASSDSRSDESSLGCTPIVWPVQRRQVPPVTSAAFLRPSPADIVTRSLVPSSLGTATLRLVSPCPGAAASLRLVAPGRGTATQRLVSPVPGSATRRLVSPAPGSAAMRLVPSIPRATAMRLVPVSGPCAAASLRPWQPSPVTSRQQQLALTPVSAVTCYTSIRPPLHGSATLRFIERGAVSRRLQLNSPVTLRPRAVTCSGSRLLEPGSASFRPPQAHLPSLGLRQPDSASFRPPQPMPQDGGLNELGAYDNHDGAGCSFW
jgi:hypothetical protein